MKRTKKKLVDLFLDSGAFSAWSKGIEIDIQDYIEFIKEHEDMLDVYANLDVIAANGITPEEAAEMTWQNQLIMEEAGLNPLPTFHYNEPVEYLQRYIDKYSYLALGGMVPISTPQLKTWLDRIFKNHICPDGVLPLVKVHGFGLTSVPLMMRYPWYSVDSTSWVITGRMGSIFMPRRKGGQWIYDENSLKITVSNRSPGMKDDKNHIENMSPSQRKIVDAYLAEKGYVLGESSFRKESQDYKLQDNEVWAEKKPKDKEADRLVEVIEQDGISNRYQLRDEMNVIYFKDLEKSMPEWPWAFVPDSATSQNSLL